MRLDKWNEGSSSIIHPYIGPPQGTINRKSLEYGWSLAVIVFGNSMICTYLVKHDFS